MTKWDYFVNTNGKKKKDIKLQGYIMMDIKWRIVF